MQHWLRKLRHFFAVWHQITNDSIILEIIKNGPKVDFQERPRIKNVPQTPPIEKKSQQ